MATVHLLSGLPCSGKTTYATQLQKRLDCAAFSLDFWLITLYGDYPLAPGEHDEHVRRVLACRKLIWSATSELLRRGVDVILDDGFFLREHRMRYAQMARELGSQAQIHHLSTPTEVIRKRLAARNAQLPTYNFRIDDDMLDVFVTMYEVPSPHEGAELVVIDGSNGSVTA